MDDLKIKIANTFRKNNTRFKLGGSRSMLKLLELKVKLIPAGNPEILWQKNVLKYFKENRDSIDYNYNIDKNDAYLLLPYVQSRGLTVVNVDNMDSQSNMILENTKIGIKFNSECIGNLQITIRNDINFYERVWDSIGIEFFFRHLWKNSNKIEGLNDPLLSTVPLTKCMIRDTMNQLFKTAEYY